MLSDFGKESLIKGTKNKRDILVQKSKLKSNDGTHLVANKHPDKLTAEIHLLLLRGEIYSYIETT